MSCFFPNCTSVCPSPDQGFPGLCAEHGQQYGFTERWTEPSFQLLWKDILTPLYHKASIVDFPMKQVQEHLRLVKDKNRTVPELAYMLFGPMGMFGIHDWLRHVMYLMLFQHAALSYALTIKAFVEHVQNRNPDGVHLDVNGANICVMLITGCDMLNDISGDQYAGIREVYVTKFMNSIEELLMVGTDGQVQVLPIPSPNWMNTWNEMKKSLAPITDHEKLVPWNDVHGRFQNIVNQATMLRNQNPDAVPLCNDKETCKKLVLDEQLFAAMLPEWADREAGPGKSLEYNPNMQSAGIAPPDFQPLPLPEAASRSYRSSRANRRHRKKSGRKHKR